MSQKELDAIADKVLAYDPTAEKGPLEVIAGEAKSPLVIGDIKISCYVLEDESRVITRRGLFAGIGADNRGGGETPDFFAQRWLKPFISNDLTMVVKSPILFHLPQGGAVAYGYPATVLADVCNAVIEADRKGATTKRQKGIVDRAILLLQGFAHIGVVALVDEATGYQRIREENALAKIFEDYITEELQPWALTFPIKFYEEICRLRGWDNILSVRRPSLVGRITNDAVYERLAPGVLDELREKNPVLPAGYRAQKHHQWLTPDLGHPKLREHLSGVMALMRASSSWHVFERNLEKAYPKPGELPPEHEKPPTLEKFFKM